MYPESPYRLETLPYLTNEVILVSGKNKRILEMTELYKYCLWLLPHRNAEILKKKSDWTCTCSLVKKPSSYCVL